jgi:ubiquinone/menaquinone biosynthesis C-methylase UbiE
LDGDRRILDIAQTKAAQAGVAIAWTLGLAFDLPYASGVFDRVLASLVLHHLTRASKMRTFAEVARVLRTGGELHILDFGAPYNTLMDVVAQAVRHLEETADHFDGLLPDLLRESGLAHVEETDHFTTIVGPMSLYHAVKEG